ncbi:MAG: 3'-5' exonuclease, partial [Inhella sp.]
TIFEQEIGPALRLPLSASYRFGPVLAAAAGRIAGKPYAALSHRHTDVQLRQSTEGEGLSTTQLAAHVALEHLKQIECRELCILLRQPSQSIGLERRFLSLGIDYRVAGFRSFLNRPEILLVRGLHAFSTGDFGDFVDKAQRAAVLEAMLFFADASIDSRELQHLHVVQARRSAIDAAARMPDGMRDFVANQVLRSASPLARRCLSGALGVLKTGDAAHAFENFLSELQVEKLARAVLVRQEDISEVVRNLNELRESAEDEGQSLWRCLASLHQLTHARPRSKSAPRVLVSSIEAAKGLEFDHVLVHQLSRGKFVGSGTLQENRNLFYVAITRARKRLTMTYGPELPSKFLIDAGLIQG